MHCFEEYLIKLADDYKVYSVVLRVIHRKVFLKRTKQNRTERRKTGRKRKERRGKERKRGIEKKIKNCNMWTNPCKMLKLLLKMKKIYTRTLYYKQVSFGLVISF